MAELGREGLVERSEGAGESVAPDPAAARGNGHQDSLAFEAPKLEKFTDMQDLVLLDPVHEVDDVGWPAARPDAAKGDCRGAERQALSETRDDPRPGAGRRPAGHVPGGRPA